MLHRALQASSAALSIGEIVAALPSGKVNPERVTLLLEVMQSRKAVVAVEDVRRGVPGEQGLRDQQQGDEQ